MPEVGAGVKTIRKEGDTPLEGDVELAAGTNVTLVQAGQKVTIASTGGGGAVAVKEDNVQVIASASALDFGLGFDVTESPSGEANVTPDFSEAAPTHAQLGSVTEDQHHARQHAIDAATDHTGVITDTQHGVRTLASAHGHGDLSGVTVGQHHFPTTFPKQARRFMGTPTLGVGNLTFTLVAARLYAFPIYFEDSQALDQILIYVTTIGTAGQGAWLGIYQDSAGYPGALLLDAGEVAVDAGGPNVIAITQTLKGLYWLALNAESVATMAIVRAGGAPSGPTHVILGLTSNNPTGIGNIQGCWYVASAYGALPDPYPAAATQQQEATLPLILVRCA